MVAGGFLGYGRRMFGHVIALGLAVVALTVMTPTPLAERREAAVMTRADLAYGSDPKQMLTLYRVAGRPPAPLVVYIHGGGWSAGDRAAGGREKPAHFTGGGYVYATVGYRFVPQVRVEDQLADVASAIAWLRKNARKHGIDRDRIVLLGHSSGAHLAAMLATDPTWLRGAGAPFDAVRAAVLIDGAGYDVPRVMAGDPGGVMRYYGPAFGADRQRQAALSPINHTAPPNAPAWLMLYDYNRMDAGSEATALAERLDAAGADTVVTGVMDSSHMLLNEQLGIYGDFATNGVDLFLAANVLNEGRPMPVDRAR
jgi:arylformamidase